MARPLRFRHSTERWNKQRVKRDLLSSLDNAIGATMTRPASEPDGYAARRFDMDNGDVALFAWNGHDAYWLGNTETPSALWRTEKYEFTAVPTEIATWAEQILLSDLKRDAPWLAEYEHLAWFFLPVLCSKDGRETSREFFREYAAGFPDSSRERALQFYDDFLATGVLDPYRYTMASKLGTSERLDRTRMAATMSEFTVAYILTEADYDVVPEIEVTTGHAIDFRAENNDGVSLVEVTRPRPPSRRVADTPTAAVRDTAAVKTGGQLSDHGGGVTLFVDCSSFPDDAWHAVAGEQPDVGHRPAVVFRARPDGHVEGYKLGRVPLDLDDVIEWV